MRIRQMEPGEYGLLRDFVYEAVFVPEGIEPPDKAIVERPELRVYYEDFGTGIADRCLAAEEDGRIIGAVWSRIMDDYGHVDDGTPSLAIALYKAYRGRGTGTVLLQEMLELLRTEGYENVSLSVQRANPAVRLYEKAGFRVLSGNEEELIMVCPLK